MESEKTLERHWYAVHTYSGYENKVKTNLERKVSSLGLEDKIFNVLVPVVDEVEKKNGVEKVIKRKLFPGYVFVEMIVNAKTWFDVRNTDGVTGFVGAGTDPTPIDEDQMANILNLMGLSEETVKPVINIDVEVGEFIKIKSGSFKDYAAKVVSVDNEKGKLKALIEMFGRETPVELDFNQVEKS
ncbi:MAG: transcription termination/antitermination protein NusG [Anaerovibrio sp.]|uniref:transcription termination/antitermination protein NusG n=1 Tax=Anaerovibrio sp. TaxID=1872532 RepID=UPI0025ED7B96|nr:transcription termination/antitermination protein NusG [Anaerovibrio sp.]MCR5177296.1 transcription termination/antitermination protein NusG [Anaerovibrio sp.]